jgi:hypothetical protein
MLRGGGQRCRVNAAGVSHFDRPVLSAAVEQEAEGCHQFLETRFA